MFEEKKDLFYLYINRDTNEPLERKETVVMIKRLFISFLNNLRMFVFSFARQRPGDIPDFKGIKVVFANTFNNYEALKFLLDRYDDSLLVCSGGGYVRAIPSAINVWRFVSSIDFGKYLFLLYLAFHSKYRLRHFRYILTYYSFIDGYVRLLKFNRPSCIFISNDHFPDSRALILSARKLGIKCIYIQHASVTKFFPPMRASHALLYGEYSENVYKNIQGSEGIFIKVGNHRFDSYKEFILNKSKSKMIGVAFNKLNSIKKVLGLCEYLAKHFPPENIVLRVHPSDQRIFETRFKTSYFSDESSLDFLKNIDVLVAGNSSILLEAAAMNVYPFQIYFDKVQDFLVDYYGFIASGIASEVRDREELVQRIMDIMKKGYFDARTRTRVFDSSVGQEFEFQVEGRIISVIDKILNYEK